jgi:hypothetical protein
VVFSTVFACDVSEITCSLSLSLCVYIVLQKDEGRRKRIGRGGGGGRNSLSSMICKNDASCRKYFSTWGSSLYTLENNPRPKTIALSIGPFVPVGGGRRLGADEPGDVLGVWAGAVLVVALAKTSRDALGP